MGSFSLASIISAALLSQADARFWSILICGILELAAREKDTNRQKGEDKCLVHGFQQGEAIKGFTVIVTSVPHL